MPRQSRQLAAILFTDIVGYTAIMLGDYNEAFNQLDEAYENSDLHMFWIKIDPSFDSIRNEQRFKNLLKKMNLN